MHKLLVTLFIIFSYSINFFGQSEKKSFLIAPSFGYTVNSQVFDDTSGTYLYHGIEGGIELGYFIRENLSLNAVVNAFDFQYDKDPHFTAPGFLVGGSLTYIKPIRDKFRIPLSLGFGYSQFNSNDTFETYKYKGYGGIASFGFEYLIHAKFGVELNLFGQAGNLSTTYQDLLYTLKYYNYATKLALNFYL